MTTTRAIPIQMTEEQIATVDALADELRVSRSSVLRALINIGLATFDAATIAAHLPPVTFGRGRPRKPLPATT